MSDFEKMRHLLMDMVNIDYELWEHDQLKKIVYISKNQSRTIECCKVIKIFGDAKDSVLMEFFFDEKGFCLGNGITRVKESC